MSGSDRVFLGCEVLTGGVGVADEVWVAGGVWVVCEAVVAGVVWV